MRIVKVTRFEEKIVSVQQKHNTYFKNVLVEKTEGESKDGANKISNGDSSSSPRASIKEIISRHLARVVPL